MEGGALVADCKVTENRNGTSARHCSCPCKAALVEASDCEHDADAAGREEEDAVSRLI